MTQIILTQERLHELFDYNEVSGYLTWKKKSNRTKIGDIAGVVSGNGRRYIGVDGQKYLSHRLVWFYVNGCWPSENLTPGNGNYDDTRIENLIECSVARTAMMSKPREGNTSGHLGVSWNSKQEKWIAQITRNYKNVCLGSFDTIEEAVECRKKAELEEPEVSNLEKDFLSEKIRKTSYFRRLWNNIIRETNGVTGWPSIREFTADVGRAPNKPSRLCVINPEFPIGPGNFIWMDGLPKQKTTFYRHSKLDQYRDKDMQRKFGITLQEYEEKFIEQKGVCAICSQPETATRNGKLRYLSIDHNHLNGEVRGLLCAACNVGIGSLKDSAEVLRKAADYIDKWNAPKETKGETDNVVRMK